MPACANCGQGNPANARYCMSCASPLPLAEATPRTARKTVTVVFCDVVDSTPLGERLDIETVREVMVRFFQSTREVLERHGGLFEESAAAEM
jgi:class 3 adenylate cyclase